MKGIVRRHEAWQNDSMWMAAVANDRVRQSSFWLAEDYKIKARLGEIDDRLIESTRNCLSESQELLAPADTLISAPLERCNKDRRPPRDILRKAMERVFDKWIDQEASPLPRSNSIH